MAKHECDMQKGPVFVWVQVGPEEHEVAQYFCSVCGRLTFQRHTGKKRSSN